MKKRPYGWCHYTVVEALADSTSGIGHGVRRTPVAEGLVANDPLPYVMDTLETKSDSVGRRSPSPI